VPRDVWVLDRDRPGASKLTSDRSDDRQPVWSPDGGALVFTSNRGGAEGLYQRTLGVAADDRLLFESGVPMTPYDWSRDGNYLAYAAGGDIWALPLSGARKPLQVTTTSDFEDVGATFSPDVRWIAYQSNESTGISRASEGDIFVQSFPQRAFKRQVSTGGGFAARWSGDGKELYYVAPDGMLMSVSVATRGTVLELGVPEPLFRPPFGEYTLATRARYSISRDGRFLIREGSSQLSITVIVNWFEQLKRGGTTN
jgi:eukaryotic-like serine/threonine-protein kinase